MIDLAEYFMGRDVEYGLLLGPDLRRNAALMVGLANKLLVLAKGAGVPIEARPDGTMTNSGWRPPALNAATPGASETSLHMQCKAIDLHDPHGLLGAWLMAEAGQHVLKDLGLWLEHPSATPGWCHVQTMPPGSGHRVFYP